MIHMTDKKYGKRAAYRSGLLATMLALSLPAGCSAQHQKCAAADIDSD
eukprot:COSAG01_NODE_72253_length_253_cov_1.012987_1_plen_47_part_10